MAPRSSGLLGIFLRGATLPVVSRQQTRPVLAGVGWGRLANAPSEILFKTTVRADELENSPFLETSQRCLLESPATSFLCISYARHRGTGPAQCVCCFF